MPDSLFHNRFKELSSPLDPVETQTRPVLKTIPGIRVIAYDFYGTLFMSEVGDIGVDDGKADPAIMLQAFTASGIDPLRADARSAAFTTYNQIVNEETGRLNKEGITYPEPDILLVWQQVLRNMSQKEMIRFDNNRLEHIAAQMAVEFEARMNPVWPMPDAFQTLSWFREKGFLQGIISNSQFYTPIILESLSGQTLTGLGFSASLLHWSFEEKRKKPDKTFYEGFLQKLQKTEPSIKPEQVLYTGNDMLKDIWPAHDVGMKTALFAGDQRSLKWRKDDDRCKSVIPDLVITSLEQLTKCVEFV